MKAVGKNVILRYRKKDLDVIQQEGKIFLIKSIGHGENACSVALIESSNNPDLPKGAEAIVSFRIAWDVNINDRDNRQTNQYFIKSEGDEEIRWAEESDIFGIIKNGKIIPKREYLFCEIPPLIPEKYGSLFIPDSFRNQKTDTKSYTATVKYINEDHKKYGLQQGDKIWAQENTDIRKKIYDEEFITIPIKKVLARQGNGESVQPIAT